MRKKKFFFENYSFDFLKINSKLEWNLEGILI